MHLFHHTLCLCFTYSTPGHFYHSFNHVHPLGFIELWQQVRVCCVSSIFFAPHTQCFQPKWFNKHYFILLLALAETMIVTNVRGTMMRCSHAVLSLMVTNCLALPPYCQWWYPVYKVDVCAWAGRLAREVDSKLRHGMCFQLKLIGFLDSNNGYLHCKGLTITLRKYCTQSLRLCYPWTALLHVSKFEILSNITNMHSYKPLYCSSAVICSNALFLSFIQTQIWYHRLPVSKRFGNLM